MARRALRVAGFDPPRGVAPRTSRARHGGRRPGRAEGADGAFNGRRYAPRSARVDDNKHVTTYLSNATAGVRNVDERTLDYHIGYLLSESTSQISQQMHVLEDRVKMLVTSSQLKGGGVTLARLASINKQYPLGIFVVCDQLTEISTKERFGLDRLEVTVFERHLLQTDDFEQMISEKIVAVLTGDAPLELPSPEEIRKRIDNDIRNTVDLPVLPQVYHQLIALDKDPESEMQDWVAAVETDPLSTAQVIRHARPPMYGFQGEINDIGKAVVLLGKNAVKEMVVAGASSSGCCPIWPQKRRLM